MGNSRLRSHELTIRKADRTSHRHPTDPGESGIYARMATARVTTPHVLVEDEEDEVTHVMLPKAQATRPQPAQGQRRALWQVTMLLRGDELSRLWSRNSHALAGRLFLWSDYAKTWVALQGQPQGLDPRARPASNDLQLRDMRDSLNSNGKRFDSEVRLRQPSAWSLPVNLTDQARALKTLPWRKVAPWALSAVFGTVAVVAVAKSSVHPEHPTLSTAALAVANNTATRSVVTPPQAADPGVISISALPLVNAPAVKVEAFAPHVVASTRAESPTPRRHHGHVAVTKSVSAPAKSANKHPVANVTLSKSVSSSSNKVTHSNPGAFDVAAARRALQGSVWQARHCTTSDVSGSVLVTFEPSGNVSNVRLGSLAGDMSRSQCIVNAFHSAHVSPFVGKAVVARKSFNITH